MRWLTALETDNESITLCRLMNIFRRKGINIASLTMHAKPEGFTLLALVEAGPAEIEHLGNFLRRTEGVTKVACYRREGGSSIPFPFGEAEIPSLTRFLETSRVASAAFAEGGSHALEFPETIRADASAGETEEPRFLPN